MKILSGGSGTSDILVLNARIVINLGPEPYTINAGYPTVANGWASEIVCPASGFALKIAKGDAYSFSQWAIGESMDEFEDAVEKWSERLGDRVAVIENGNAELQRLEQAIYNYA